MRSKRRSRRSRRRRRMRGGGFFSKLAGGISGLFSKKKTDGNEAPKLEEPKAVEESSAPAPVEDLDVAAPDVEPPHIVSIAPAKAAKPVVASNQR